ncbi:hypothetical protein OG871_39795 (plasmid) [Kitasatospora sp. NBC_00374]|uniref:hypothetical protein n=1 Tax=Kitasatospora sp. NBC_00374 TaxID=2975964 RepID=UPI0030E1B205
MTSTILPSTDDRQVSYSVRELAKARKPIVIDVPGDGQEATAVRYHPESDPVTEALAVAAVRHAYPDLPAVGTLMLDSATEYHLWQQAVAADRRTPGIVDRDRLRQHEYTHLLLRGVALDVVALQSQGDIHSAAQCARAANELRRLDGIGAVPQETARTWLRATYRERLLDGPHAWDCAGGCGSLGTVMRYFREDGVIVHQEPDECDRGIPAEAHEDDCVCAGTGQGVHDGQHHVCLGYAEADDILAVDDPWASTGR